MMEQKNPKGKSLSPLVSEKSKVVCVGLNYRSHAEHAGFPIPQAPAIFCKFSNALAFDGDAVELGSLTVIKQKNRQEAPQGLIFLRKFKFCYCSTLGTVL